MPLGSPDIFASDSSSDSLFSASDTSDEREAKTPPDAPLTPRADPRAALDTVLAAAPDETRADLRARFDALDPAGRAAFAAESGKVAELFRSARRYDAEKLCNKLLPQWRETNENSKDTYKILENAIGRENIEKSPAYAEAKRKITPKTHPDPEKREAAMTAYAILHDAGLQTIARQNLGETKANDLIFELQRQFPEPKSLRTQIDPPNAPWTRREEHQFAAIGGDPKKPVDRVGDAYAYTDDQGRKMRFDTSSVPPVISRVDERMGGVAAEVRAAPFDRVEAAGLVVANFDQAIKVLEAKKEGIEKRIGAVAEKMGSPIDADDADKTAQALDGALAAQEERAKGNGEAVGFDPNANPLDDPAALARYEPRDDGELGRLQAARSQLSELRKELRETADAITQAREQALKAEAEREDALVAYKASLEEANERAGRNLDYFNDAGGRLLGPDGLSTVFDTVNNNVGYRRTLGLPSAFDLSGELEEEHRRAFARIMTGLIGEDLFDPTSQTLKKERQTEDGRTVPLDDEYIRDKFRERGIVSGADGAIDTIMLEQAARNVITPKQEQ